MSAFYQRMKTNVADKLLKQFNQGDIVLVQATSIPPANPWDAPTTTEARTPLNAIAKGVSEQYVDGVTILSTDIEIVSAVPINQPKVSDFIEIDGKTTTLLRIIPIPAAGLTVAHKFLVRA